MGSDEFSVPSLEACLAKCNVVAVYTQPDRPSGRGRKRLSVSPVKELALARGLRVVQPERFDKRCSEQLRDFGSDLTVVAAYGHILPAAALAAARIESINVHASLLPRHRGAAPVAAAILAGDTETGVTVMRLRPALDTGEVVCYGKDACRAQRVTPIGEHETAGELMARLAVMGGELAAEVLGAFADGSVTYEVQDEARATYARRLEKSDGRIDWRRPADAVDRQIRAMTPWPGAFTDLCLPAAEPVRLVVLRAGVCECGESGRVAGRIDVQPGPRLVVSAGAGCVELLRLKPAGRKEMSAAEFVRGSPVLRECSGRGECGFASG